MQRLSSTTVDVYCVASASATCRSRTHSCSRCQVATWSLLVPDAAVFRMVQPNRTRESIQLKATFCASSSSATVSRIFRRQHRAKFGRRTSTRASSAITVGMTPSGHVASFDLTRRALRSGSLNLPSGSNQWLTPTLADNAVWVYYYSQFPVVRIDRDGRTRGWSTETRGAQALAVDSRRILLFGGYGTDRDRVVLAEFGQTQLANIADYRLVFPSGDPVDDIAAVIGRGPILLPIRLVPTRRSYSSAALSPRQRGSWLF